jgi:hypothetical protein
LESAFGAARARFYWGKLGVRIDANRPCGLQGLGKKKWPAGLLAMAAAWAAVIT